MYISEAINIPRITALAVFHVWYLIFSLSFISKYYLIFIAISYLTHDCLISKHMGFFQLSFSLMNSSVMSLLSENTICMISVLWNLLSCLVTQNMGNVDKYLLCPWKEHVFYICWVYCFIIRSNLLTNFVQTVYILTDFVVCSLSQLPGEIC